MSPSPGGQNRAAIGARLPPRDHPIRRQSNGDQAARYIRQLIFDGVLEPGAHVPQEELAASLGMSRIPIREALFALERQGWVNIELHRGAFVQALDPNAIQDHYELFGLVYGFAAMRAIERADDDALAVALAAQVDELDELVDDPVAFGRAARRFHAQVVAASGSPRTSVVLRSLSSLVPGDFFSHVPDAVNIERRGLRRIAEAIARSNGQEAADEYTEMMRPIGRLVIELFEQRGLFVGPDTPDSTSRT